MLGRSLPRVTVNGILGPGPTTNPMRETFRPQLSLTLTSRRGVDAFPWGTNLDSQIPMHQDDATRRQYQVAQLTSLLMSAFRRPVAPSSNLGHYRHGGKKICWSDSPPVSYQTDIISQLSFVSHFVIHFSYSAHNLCMCQRKRFVLSAV